MSNKSFTKHVSFIYLLKFMSTYFQIDTNLSMRTGLSIEQTHESYVLKQISLIILNLIILEYNNSHTWYCYWWFNIQQLFVSTENGSSCHMFRSHVHSYWIISQEQSKLRFNLMPYGLIYLIIFLFLYSF